MNLTEKVETIRKFATSAITVYPFFAAIYIVGFFSQAPYDLVSSISFTDFLVKSAISFLVLAALGSAWIAVNLFAYIGDFSEEKIRQNKGENTSEVVRWETASNRRKAFIITIFFATLGLFIFAAWLDDWDVLPKTPAGLLGTLAVVTLWVGSFLRIFVDRLQWFVMRSFWLAFALFSIPFGLGSLDYDLSEGPAFFTTEEANCPIRFIGADDVLVSCEGGEFLYRRDQGVISFERMQ